MQKLIGILLAVLLTVSVVEASPTYVKGYTKQNGTNVSGYYRTSPNSTVRDNYNYYGNSNPYSGNTGTNKYKSNSTSGYYTPSSNTSNSWLSD